MNLKEYIESNLIDYAKKNDFKVIEGDGESSSASFAEVDANQKTGCINDMFQDIGFEDFCERFDEDGTELRNYMTSKEEIRTANGFIQWLVDKDYWGL